MKSLKLTLSLVQFSKWLVIILWFVVAGFIWFMPNDTYVKIKGLKFEMEDPSSEEIDLKPTLETIGENSMAMRLVTTDEITLHTRLSYMLKGVIFLVLVVVFGMVVLILDNMEKIVVSIRSAMPFSVENVSRLRLIGTVVMVSPVLELVLHKFLVAWISTNYRIQSLSMDHENSFGQEIFILGLLIYTLGYAFQKGIEIQEENKLTV